MWQFVVDHLDSCDDQWRHLSVGFLPIRFVLQRVTIQCTHATLSYATQIDDVWVKRDGLTAEYLIEMGYGTSNRGILPR